MIYVPLKPMKQLPFTEKNSTNTHCFPCFLDFYYTRKMYIRMRGCGILWYTEIYGELWDSHESVKTVVNHLEWSQLYHFLFRCLKWRCSVPERKCNSKIFQFKKYLTLLLTFLLELEQLLWQLGSQGHISEINFDYNLQHQT